MKFTKYLLSVIALVVLFDITFGLVSNYYVKNYPLPGDYKSIDYIIKKSKDSILILGSSVALNSLMPSVIEDSLQLSCFNGGGNGQKIIFFRTMLDCVLKRYKPKMIILGLMESELSNDGLGRYNFLTPYYHTGYEIIDSCLESKSRFQKFLMQSSLYRYNTSWFRLFLYHFITPNENGYKGFVAKSKPLSPTIMTETKGNQKLATNASSTFNNIVKTCLDNNIKLIIYTPPLYTHITNPSATVDYIEDTCNKYNIPFYYDSQDSTFLSHNEWFHDNNHLDKEGAYVYTKQFIHRIRKELQND